MPPHRRSGSLPPMPIAVAGPHGLAACRFRLRILPFIAAPVKNKRGRLLLAKFPGARLPYDAGITALLYTAPDNMCNGANLAYERQTFYEVTVFDCIDTLPAATICC